MNVSSRSRGIFEVACLLTLATAACGADAESNSVRDGVGPTGTGPATSGRSSGTGGAAPPDFGGRPTMIVPIDPSTVPLGGSGCLSATVLFVVDGSGSMSDPFGGVSRWQALRTALLEPMNGFIPRFQNEAEFGLMIYDGNLDGGGFGRTTTEPAAGMMCTAGAPMNLTCPRLVRVPPKLANLMPIDTMFPIEPLGGSTPTDKAMSAAVDEMIMLSMGKDALSNPHFIILATDGQPNDICSGGGGDSGDKEKACVVSAVDRAAAANITTYVISLAGQDQELEMHLAEVAKHGNPKDPAAHTFSPMTPDDLVMTLRAVLTSALGCVI